ncbi:hypothetical protein BDZ45DRAFT_761200 [Acephala macrosclerotiorum]|nr:hypothetical protein BDZ45DRAFT_761200 [Acephala macrosclerotiorum]
MDRTTLPTGSEQTDDDFSGVSRRSFEAPWVVADGGNDWTSAVIVSGPQNLPKNMQILPMQPLPTLHPATTMGHSPESSGTIQPAVRRPPTSTHFGEPVSGYNYGSSPLAEPGSGARKPTHFRVEDWHRASCQTLGELSQSPNTPAFEHLTSFTSLPIDLHSSNQTTSPYAGQGATSTVEAGNQREKYPEYTWDFYKPIIEQHCLYENKPLREVIQIMADRYTFQASLKMYKTRFAKWGFRKSITDKEARILLNVKWQRENEGKTTLFLSPTNKVVKLKKHLQRKNKSEYDIVDLTHVAERPARLIYRTPSPIPQFLQSPEFQGAQGRLIASITTVFKAWYEQDLQDGTRPLHMRLRRTGDDMIGRLTQASVQLQCGNVYEAYSSRHPLSAGLKAIYSILESQGVPAFRDLLDDCAERAAEQIERIYGESHPVTLGCWDLVAMFYSNKIPRRISTVYDRLREHHEIAEATSGQGSLEELDLRYCYAFHLCYGRQSNHEEAAKYLSEFLKVLRDGKNQDNALAEWCLRLLAGPNHEVSSSQDSCFNPRQGDARDDLENPPKLQTGYATAGYEELAEGRSCEIVYLEGGLARSFTRGPGPVEIHTPENAIPPPHPPADEKSSQLGPEAAREHPHQKHGRHCDIKPESILHFDRGILSVADLGLGRFKAAMEQPYPKDRVPPRYRPPEF